MALKFITDERNDRQPLELLSDNLMELDSGLNDSFDSKVTYPLIDFLSEATLNSVNHAYLKQTKFPYIGKRWWAMACFSSELGEKLFVF